MKRIGIQDMSISESIMHVENALREKKYDPVRQIIGYLLSGDPIYITTHKNARNIMYRLDRDAILEELVRTYLDKNNDEKDKEDASNKTDTNTKIKIGDTKRINIRDIDGWDK